MSENHRGPEVPEVRVPVVECLDGFARITSKELAITHPVKDGILLNACSTRTRMVAVLGKSVNGIHPAPEIHEHFMVHKGYGTLRISSRTTSTILSVL